MISRLLPLRNERSIVGRDLYTLVQYNILKEKKGNYNEFHFTMNL